jgi:signal transduction histidine kinase
MKSRSSHVRTKVVALLVCIAALWGFAAFVTAREGLNLLWVQTLDKGIAQPLETLVPALQQERRLTAVYLGSRNDPARAGTAHADLVAQRARTDSAAAQFKRSATASDVRLASSAALRARLDETFRGLDSLGAGRDDIDAGRVSRLASTNVLTGIVDSVFRMYDSLATLDDDQIAKDVRTLIQLTRAREVLSQEDALLAGAIAARELSAEEHDRFTQSVAVHRFLQTDAASRLPAADLVRYNTVVASDDYARLVGLEDRVIQAGRDAGQVPVTAPEWATATQRVEDSIEGLSLAGGDDVVGRATPVAALVILRLALAGGLGLLAVIASIIISITTARSLIRQLERLRAAANDLASVRLPRLVERLAHGERVDIEHEAPPLDFGRDEIGQVGQAFNDVQSTAVRVAVEQAELRRSVRDVFLSLARRSQALLHRQLGLLDGMERRTTDAEELSELFRVDHLATRMRRNAENLIVLSGATAGRAWRKPVPMVDVLRGALAEVEDYTRVTVLPVGSALLVGRAVGDVIHLLAELIENAVSFSPPQTVVRVGGSVVGNGFAIEIEDRGLGMSPDERSQANDQLADPPDFTLTSTARLGLYVVAKLAERHSIRVRLTDSPYGGTTAIVLLPATLIAEESPGEVYQLDGAEYAIGRLPHLAAIGAGRHRQESVTAQAEVVTPVDDTPLYRETRYEPPVRADPPVLTPSGLPWRQRRTAERTGPVRPPSRVPDPPRPATETDGGNGGNRGNGTPPVGRGLEDMRNLMGSYRAGTLRGRSDAARSLEEPPTTDEKG